MDMIVDLEDATGWIGCIISTSFYIISIAPFYKVIQGKLYFEDSPGFFISACYANCFLWWLYGDLSFSDTVKTTNAISSLICLFGMMIYIFYERKKYLLDSILNFFLIIMVSWSVFKYLSIEVDDPRVAGKYCFCSSIIVFSYFLYNIHKIIIEKKFTIIKFTNITIYFLNSIIWVCNGLSIKDFYIIIPNSLGVLISLVQIIVYLKYQSKYPCFVEENNYTDTTPNISTIVIEKTGNEDKKEDEAVIKIGDEDQSNIKEKPVKIISKVHN